MTDSIEKVTLENAAEQLKSKIRMAFVELLPEAQWKEMVATELKRFTQQTSRYDNYQAKHIDVPSEFSKLCTEVFTEHLKEQIRSVLNGPEWRATWGSDGKLQISEAIKAWLTANSKQLIESTVQAMVAHAAQSLVQVIR